MPATTFDFIIELLRVFVGLLIFFLLLFYSYSSKFRKWFWKEVENKFSFKEE
jgi:hypothetical protein